MGPEPKAVMGGADKGFDDGGFNIDVGF